jgi:hypothetical protein
MVTPASTSDWHLDTLAYEIGRLMLLSEFHERRGDLKAAHGFEMAAYDRTDELDRLQRGAEREVVN